MHLRFVSNKYVNNNLTINIILQKKTFSVFNCSIYYQYLFDIIIKMFIVARVFFFFISPTPGPGGPRPTGWEPPIYRFVHATPFSFAIYWFDYGQQLQKLSPTAHSIVGRDYMNDIINISFPLASQQYWWCYSPTVPIGAIVPLFLFVF